MYNGMYNGTYNSCNSVVSLMKRPRHGRKAFQAILVWLWWRCPVQRWYVLTLSVAHVVFFSVWNPKKWKNGDPFGGAKVIRIAGGVFWWWRVHGMHGCFAKPASKTIHFWTCFGFPWIPMMQEVDPEERWVRSFLEWMESDYILFRCEFESFRVCQYFMVLSRKHVLICKLDMMTIRCDGRTLSRHNDVAVFSGVVRAVPHLSVALAANSIPQKRWGQVFVRSDGLARKKYTVSN
jgi:hypothetical protein